ncbi:MAG: type II/IV secretion system ATPase subunit [Candidatus Altiarchaeota archaeon]|nr:type II/IV secretion system ATPase subunit [Candidatus Altiarchaeota archaeon]
MACKATLKNAKTKQLCIDCSKCTGAGSLDSPRCLGNAMELLRRNRADELKFVKKEFSELYGTKEVELLTEFLDLVKKFEEEKIWERVKCKIPEDEEHYRKFVREFLSGLARNPVKAYEMMDGLLRIYQGEHEYLDEAIYKYKCNSHRDKVHDKDLVGYMPVLEEIMADVRQCRLSRAYLDGTHKDALRPVVQPSFVYSRVDLNIPKDSELLSMYKVADAEVRVYESDGDKLYFINPPEIWLRPNHVGMLAKLNEYLSKEHSLEIFDPSEARLYFKNVGDEKLPKIAEEATTEELKRLSEIFARYSAGYGVLEIIFRDRRISDIYVDSPPGSSPVYINHELYGSCVTNLYLTEDDMERLSSKFRAISERPFDEANPILDMDLKDVGVRVAGLREPSTFDGLAYAFRKHRENPWTLAKFVERGMLSSKTAALLSFLISGQSSMLITGARGAGKTSLLSSILAEVDQRERIILMEDTAEIPSRSLRKKGWKIEHLKNQAVIAKKKGYELAPEDNLRAALRLGESVLVLGEVRGTEARVLFEAMRVGAAGNAVLGTIHGSSPYDTWDRVTNDLGVPPTSFKAVDIIVSLRYREIGPHSSKSRRLMQVTEVGKKWNSNPEEEGAFFDLMKFNEHTGTEEHYLEGSKVIKDICRRKGITFEEFEKLLSAKERIIEDLVAASKGCDDLLEISCAADVNKRYRMLCNNGGIEKIYPEWAKWFKEYSEGVKAAAGGGYGS